MNKLILMGRLTADPEVRYTQDSKAVASFNFAVNRRFDRENSDFFRCVAFGKTAEGIEKMVKKGTKLVIAGSIQNNNYTDKNGVKRYEMQVIVEEFCFCESKNSNEGISATNTQTSPDGFMDIPDGIDEELPFE